MSISAGATPAQLAAVKLMVPGIETRINKAKLDVIATNMDAIVFDGVTVSQFLPQMVQVCRASTDDLVDLVRKINFKRVSAQVRDQHNDMISRHGFALHSAFAGDGKSPDFCYTVGLNLKVGFELIIVAGNDTLLLHHTTGHYADAALRGEDLTMERNDIVRMRKFQSYGVRTKCVKVAPWLVLQNYISHTCGTVRDVYQILIADKNNLFPDEQGYDTNWRQPKLMVALP